MGEWRLLKGFPHSNLVFIACFGILRIEIVIRPSSLELENINEYRDIVKTDSMTL